MNPNEDQPSAGQDAAAAAGDAKNAVSDAKHTVEDVKQFRKDVDALIQRLQADFGPASRELSLVKTKLQEAKMWAGKELENLGSELPAEFQDKATPAA